jgi:hypothetical protein
MEHSAMHDMTCHPSIGLPFLLCEASLLVGELKIRRLARDKMPCGGVGFKGANRAFNRDTFMVRQT